MAYIATICGNGLDPLFKACQEAGLRLVDVRNEQAAGYIAEVTGRLSRRVGVCAASSGVAHVNAMTGVVNAYFDGAPMLLITGSSLFYCGIVGLVVTGLIIWITEYYTGTEYRPVKAIALASETGHGTNVIQGLAISLESTAVPALIIIGGIIVTNILGGLFGIAIAVTTMLALAGVVVALDAFEHT